MAKKATTEQPEATVETSASEMTLEELQAKIAELERANKEKDATIEKLEGRDEGWLIKTANPAANEKGAYGIQFVDGLAFLQKDRKFEPPYDNAEKMAKFLHSDFGYEIKYFKKEDWDQLEDIKVKRARERVIAEEKLKSQGEWMKKLVEHRI